MKLFAKLFNRLRGKREPVASLSPRHQAPPYRMPPSPAPAPAMRQSLHNKLAAEPRRYSYQGHDDLPTDLGAALYIGLRQQVEADKLCTRNDSEPMGYESGGGGDYAGGGASSGWDGGSSGSSDSSSSGD